ncbi:uncharacterized protein EV420DRAFT_249174 [Desarmillaria tabescens]|uniref:Uncharacterized protein n=1 Tax=Armillaria tabescens TaxID=1929756 RepID=A0AA39KF66_ARMTA|nr:uncharacterized protein EV420DRAFT_249174 [Desarmillaria tabescens]KAK0460056.1 hypothetical protein EV420DRAFT_249174 [Desarmillaria tabescens]
MQWTTTDPSLTQKYSVYFTAVQYFLADIRHYNVIRDVGELLSASEYEDDLDLGDEEDDYDLSDSFINDSSDIKEEHEEGESSDTADESEASSSTEESAHTSDTDGSQSYVSDDVDPESNVQTPLRNIRSNDTASLGSTYRLGKRYDGRSPSPTPPSPTLRKRRQASPDPEASDLDPPLVPGTSKANSISKASPRRHRFSSADSSEHTEGSDDAEENEPKAKQRNESHKGSETRRRRTQNGGKLMNIS